MTDLASVLRDQRQYLQARKVYRAVLTFNQRIENHEGQATIKAELGSLALEQGNYAEAQAYLTEALHTFQTLDEPAKEAIIWYQLGMVARTQQNWTEAERYYRASLAIDERLGRTIGAAKTCDSLASITRRMGRPIEAEGWYRRALELFEQANPGGSEPTLVLYNLASLLADEVSAGRTVPTRLAEAKRYAEQALAFEEMRETSEKIWNNFRLLAQIADLEGQAEEAKRYVYRLREAIDRQFGPLITTIAAGARGNIVAMQVIEAAFPKLEAQQRQIAAATRLIWTGERDRDVLTKELDTEDTLLILRVLETIAAQEKSLAQPTSEELMAPLPTSVLDALQQGDETAFDQALIALAPEGRQRVLAALQALGWEDT